MITLDHFGLEETADREIRNEEMSFREAVVDLNLTPETPGDKATVEAKATAEGKVTAVVKATVEDKDTAEDKDKATVEVKDKAMARGVDKVKADGEVSLMETGMASAIISRKHVKRRSSWCTRSHGIKAWDKVGGGPAWEQEETASDQH